MSIGFLLRDRDDAVIWRGPMKYQIIKQFLKDVKWGSLDFLIIDSPPGTGDEPLSIVQLLADADGALVVTTPQQIALSDVRKSISFCRNLNLPILGVLENMSGFVCPKCLGRIPIDPQVVEACDSGKPFVRHHNQNQTARAFEKISDAILQLDNNAQELVKKQSLQKGDKKMRIAIPVSEGKLSQHFGHCDTFAIILPLPHMNLASYLRGFMVKA